MTGHKSLSVDLGDRSYDILIGTTVLAAAGKLMQPLLKSDRVIIVTDENVAALHLARLERALDDAGLHYQSIAVAPGDTSKSLDQLGRLIDQLLAAKVERSTTILALGGGVIGDLAGFAAAVTLRGLDFIQIPTSLLAQVDSSVGGKTGINSRHGKNLIGAFYQPRLVLADTSILTTLPRREMLAGYAEVVKYGLIQDAAFFTWLESHGADLIEGDRPALERAVLTSCRCKAEVVAADEREGGRRALLNLGHTFGHALEAETGYGGELLHGEAVAVGMVMAFDLSVQRGHCPPEDADRLRRHLAAVGLPTGFADLPQRHWDAERLLDHMGRDKKVNQGRINFVLARGIGEAYIESDVKTEEVMALLTSAISQSDQLANENSAADMTSRATLGS
ncbi:3-dehydroquinate synthase [Pelagibius litoralis]|uniref:3-dehydroquinate synthase n=1 Tax=Pelagibius litoralis TaxID=374515 RepID=A0A967F286_9PROT|nr:3-dehydroquinate synthase [Pelagibius litoralis]